MNKLHPDIALTPPANRYVADQHPETHVEIVDEAGFAGYDPTSEDILDAYIRKHGHRPYLIGELVEFGNLVLSTALYHEELIKEGEREIMFFGLESEELRDVSDALSLDNLHSRQVFPALSVIRRNTPQIR